MMMYQDVDNDNEQNVKKWLQTMYNVLSKKNINLNDVRNQILSGKELFVESKQDYLLGLLFPKLQVCRIPRLVATPSFLTQMHFTINLTTNTSGNCVVAFNPCYFGESSCPQVGLTTAGNPDYRTNGDVFPLAATGTNAVIGSNGWSTFFVNNDATLTGYAQASVAAGNSALFFPYNIGQNSLPTGNFGSHSVTAAEMEVQYIGTLDRAQGLIGGGVALNTNKTYAWPPTPPIVPVAGVANKVGQSAVVGGVGRALDDLDEFTQISNIENLNYFYRTQLINGLKMNYFPPDEKSLNYFFVANQFTNDDNGTSGTMNSNTRAMTNVGYCSPWGFCWVFYILGGPPSQTVAKVDIYLNVEFLVQPAARNFINTDVNMEKGQRTVSEATQFLLKNPRFITGPASGSDDSIGTYEGFIKGMKPSTGLALSQAVNNSY